MSAGLKRLYFNPRPHEEGDLRGSVAFGIGREFQSTPSRGGRPCRRLLLRVAAEISIHALTRRATICATVSQSARLFQSTPSRGGRPFSISRSPSLSHNFNPRPHEEGDRDNKGEQPQTQISIHALTRRATLGNLEALHTRQISIHALTRRATTIARQRSGRQGQFQSTPSRGGRQQTVIKTIC